MTNNTPSFLGGTSDGISRSTGNVVKVNEKVRPRVYGNRIILVAETNYSIC